MYMMTHKQTAYTCTHRYMYMCVCLCVCVCLLELPHSGMGLLLRACVQLHVRQEVTGQHTRKAHPRHTKLLRSPCTAPELLAEVYRITAFLVLGHSGGCAQQIGMAAWMSNLQKELWPKLLRSIWDICISWN